MNIFYLDQDPYVAARWHGDKHVSKMIIETAQMLSTAHHVLSKEYDANGKPFSHKANKLGLYKPTHINHPCSKWIRENSANYDWAWKLFEGLCSEFYIRRAKIHATERLLDTLKIKPDITYALKYTTPALAMPDEFKTDNPVESYRRYYKYKFLKGIVTYEWSEQRKAPAWLKKGEIDVETHVKK